MKGGRWKVRKGERVKERTNKRREKFFFMVGTDFDLFVVWVT